MKKLSIRIIRKTAHLSHQLLTRGSRFTKKVEDKTTRILSGTDYSIQVDQSIPFEKIYYTSIPHVLPLNPAMPAIGSKPSVTLLIPSLDGSSFFGGTATALVVAAKLALASGMRLRIVQTLKTGRPKSLNAFFLSEGVPMREDDIQIISIADRAYNTYGYISMHPEDIYIASAWWDAHLLQKLPLTKRFIYLIQDFEPIFYNNSDMYILAEETYRQGNYVPLCNTKLMFDFMSERAYQPFTDSPSFWFEPAVSRISSGQVTKKRAGEKKNLFIYGRPNVHRNLFFTALTALDYAFQAGFLDKNEWNCYMAGQEGLSNIDLPSRVNIKNLGKMGMQEYIDFSKTIDIAISPMMAPHPNYPTLEFASIGSAVVTTKYANKVSLDNYSKNIFMSEIDTASIAGAIRLAAELPYSKRTNNLRTTSIPNSWDKSLDTSIKAILSVL